MRRRWIGKLAEELERARVRGVREAEMDNEREIKRQAAEAKKQAAWANLLRKPVRNGIVSTIRSTLTQPKIKTVPVVSIGGKRKQRKQGKQTRKRRRKSTQHK